jgi:hypothetical protein
VPEQHGELQVRLLDWDSSWWLRSNGKVVRGLRGATVGFVAPELRESRSASKAGDLWALALSAWFLTRALDRKPGGGRLRAVLARLESRAPMERGTASDALHALCGSMDAMAITQAPPTSAAPARESPRSASEDEEPEPKRARALAIAQRDAASAESASAAAE